MRARLVTLGTEVLIDALAQGLGPPEPQLGEPVYAAKITSADRHIDWSQPAIQIHRQVRVGGAWTTFRNQHFKIWRTAVADSPVAEATPAAVPGSISGVSVATGDRRIDLLEVQAQGRTRQVAFAWLNGARLTPEDRFV